MSLQPLLRLFFRAEHAIDLLYVLVMKELRVRYKRTLLGYAWSLLLPLAFAGVYFIVFKQFIRLEIPGVDYSLFLICGLFAWQWFNNGVAGSTMAVIGNGPLITKVRFPRVYAVLSGFFNDLVHFLLASPVVFGFLFWFGYPVRLSWLWWLPLLFGIQAAMVLGFSLLFSAVTLFLRDLERLVSIGLLMLFHLTPVVYSETMIPDRFRWLLTVNPMASLVVNWRDALLHGHVQGDFLLASLSAAAVALLVGGLTFRALQDRFAELI